ncbi:16S rRNA (uracil(1498)-N(3))-methyltransferase [Moraxella haemolytica]|uniref:16S rRNA (uracil(1498)-N(3))-methyltransferase n=1 Tax=Moraxella haemolytica TaxID=2904119 RepID=UPI002543127A|nr:16S rRNA (uracil(1498)-N(3))-methyltransferase [Moraxella sp. ZY171148]WII94727.1 16S rRNA (uracil(1498)-N(3))-methyltransferase [Moraxella sp. ZY171148]
MNRFFVAEPLNINQHLILPNQVHHHWCKVLRAKVGDTAILFNGQGGEYTATLIDMNQKSATVRLDTHNPTNRTPPYAVTLGQVMSRGERMDYAIQKATEMGVRHIQLLTSDYCQEHLKYERDKKKLIHWQNIAIAACEQCGLNIVPSILPPIDLASWLSTHQSALKLMMAVSDGKFTPTRLPDDITLLVGPEGGLSSKEIELAIFHGFHAWTIGERVLRTETAPVVALSALQTLHDITQ